MIRKSSEKQVSVKELMRGGDGSVILEEILTPSELYDKGRLFSRIVVKKGCSVGYHVHENEMECYFIVSGSGEYDDNGTVVTVNPGDATLTVSGEGHAIKNNCDEDLVLIALIIFK